MIPNANARHFRIKAAQRDLIAACGGIERAAQICNYGKSTVGRWNSAESSDMMPVEAAIALEEECGRHDFTEAFVSLRGRKLADREGDLGTAECIMSGFGEFAQRASAALASLASSIADNHWTPAEATKDDKALAELEDAIENLRKGLAHVKASGGQELGRPALKAVG